MTRQKESKAITKIDPSKAHSAVNERCYGIRAGERFSTAQLRSLLRERCNFPESDDELTQLIYTWKYDGIIRPESNQQGASGQRPDFYSAEQVRRAVMAAYLREQRVPNSEIAGAVEFWSDAELSEERSFALLFNELDRAEGWLGSRLLSAVTGLALGRQGPPRNSIVACRRVSGSMRGHPPKYHRLENPPRLIPGQMLVGYATNRPEAEVFARVRDFGEIDPLLAERNFQFYGIQIPSPGLLMGGTDDAYEVVIGIDESATDPRANALVTAADGVGPGITKGSIDQLCILLEYVFCVLLKLRGDWSGHQPRYRLRQNADYLQGLATAILPANPIWSDCAFYVRDDKDVLRLRSYSPTHPGRPETLPLDPQHNLESLVFQSEEYLIVEDVEEDDPRIPDRGRHLSAYPFAIIPALSREGVEGVVCVNAHGVHPGSARAFPPAHASLLHFLSGILAEAHVRQRFTTVDHLFYSLPETRSSDGTEVDLQKAIEDLLRNEVISSPGDADEMLVLFTVNMRTDRPVKIQSWFDEQISWRLSSFLRSRVNSRRFSKSINIYVYRVDPGKIVALVRSMSMGIEFPSMREELREAITAFSDTYKGVEAHLWSVQFRYSYLAGLLRELRPVPDSEFRAQAKAVMKYAHRALDNSALLHEADGYLRDAHYEKALRTLERISSEDAYVLRHKAEACIGLRRWSEAKGYAERAIEEDHRILLPGYPGSHLRLAQALVGMGETQAGLNEFHEAAKLGVESRYKAEYARALIQYGTEDHVEEAIGQISELLGRLDLGDSDKSQLCVIRARAEKRLGKPLNAAASLLLALDFDRNNLIAKWDLADLQLARKSEVETP